ncbi:MAG: Gfo/Idh/MocA family oxidoreductase [Cyclobacteriaceae bacterium]
MQFLIIGAGQLGSRHLQGLLKLNGKNEIYVIDPSQDSLSLASVRAMEVKHHHELHFHSDWENLPQNFDLAIIATSSVIRGQVTVRLISNYKVRYLILEKVLFPDLSTYEYMAKLFNKLPMKCWVNHPRRMFEHFKIIRKQLLPDQPIYFLVTGANWGLACNGLHFLDIICYLSNSTVRLIDSSTLDNLIVPSKRSGYIEFTGSLRGTLASGSNFEIVSWPSEFSPISITITQASNRFLIQEGTIVKVVSIRKENNYCLELQDFEISYQSQLTTDAVNQIIESGESDLTLYQEASFTHQEFLRSFLLKYNQITGINHSLCPIT